MAIDIQWNSISQINKQFGTIIFYLLILKEKKILLFLFLEVMIKMVWMLIYLSTVASEFAQFEYIFTFNSTSEIPIVLPGANVVFPNTILKSSHIHINEENNVIGLPKGIYFLEIQLHPADSATIALIVNKTIYKMVSTVNESRIDLKMIVNASSHAEIEIRNHGTNLFILNSLINHVNTKFPYSVAFLFLTNL